MLSARPMQISVENVDGRVSVKGPITGSKTPGRGLHKSRGALRENAIGSHTVQRHLLNNKQTPFRIKTQQHSTKPLLDKTPFHNRQNPLSTPAPQTFKIAKLTLEDHDNFDRLNAPVSGSTTLRPSSTRKSLRGRISGESTSENALTALSFQTPVNQGRHWDVSDISIDVPNGTELRTEDVEEDYDEIEYMPERETELDYQPPFDFVIPDYKEVGLKLRSLAQLYKFDDEDELLLEDAQLSEAATSELSQSVAPRLILPNLVDDYNPFSVNDGVSGHSKIKLTKPAVGRRTGTSELKSTLTALSKNSSVTRAKPSMASTIVRPKTANRGSGTSSVRHAPPPVSKASSVATGESVPRTVARTVPKSLAKRVVPSSSKVPTTRQTNDEMVLVFNVGAEHSEEFRFDV